MSNYKKRSCIYLKGVRTVSEQYHNQKVKQAIRAKRKAEKRLLIAYIIIAILAIFLLFEVAYTSREIDKLDNQINDLKVKCETLRDMLEINPLNLFGINSMRFNATEIETPEDIDEENGNLPDKYNSIPLSEELKNYIYTSSQEAGIPAELMFSLAWKESTFNPNAKSGTSDHGLFQINECNFSKLSEEFGYTYSEFAEKIYDPYVNTDCSIYILKDYRDNYNNDNYHQLLMRYNMGPKGAADAFESGKYTSSYSVATLNYAKENFGLDDINLD